MTNSLVDIVATAQHKVAYAEMCWGPTNVRLLDELQRLARVYMIFNEPELAERVYWRVLKMQYQIFGVTHVSNAETLVNLGGLHSADPQLAVQFFEEALWLLEQNCGEQCRDLLVCVLKSLLEAYRLTKQMSKLTLIARKLCLLVAPERQNNLAELFPAHCIA